MSNTRFINRAYIDLDSTAQQLSTFYREATPFPHIVIDNFFNTELLSRVANEFPNLSTDKSTTEFNDRNQIKLGSCRGDSQQPETCQEFMRYLNSHQFIEFLHKLTSIKEPIIPDPHFVGGGFHEVKRDGLLKLHLDFARHYETNLDRRINILIYLNKNWEESYGGHLQLWDKNTQQCGKKILPIFNRLAIFNTTDNALHGHPDPVTCPADRSRKSIALYYYSNGRPKDERRGSNWELTLFKERPGETYGKFNGVKQICKYFLPPIVPMAYYQATRLLNR
jgi:Rps23 Pro-64 3,4-dihydroxylase Tpa1-like proline 4-hydroxylase